MKKIFTYTLSLVLISSYLFHITSCTKDSGPIIITPNDTSSTIDSVSFQTDIQPIFTNNCTGCHNLNDDSGTGLDLSDGTSYGLLVNVTSYGYPPVLRVKPFSADSSVLWHKDAGTGVYGQQMPPGGPYLQSFEMDNIKKWIDQGAKNN